MVTLFFWFNRHSFMFLIKLRSDFFNRLCCAETQPIGTTNGNDLLEYCCAWLKTNVFSMP